MHRSVMPLIKRVVLTAASAAAFTTALPAPAAADVLLTPFAGVTFHDDVRKSNYGVTVGFGGLIGLEFDISQSRLGTYDQLLPFVRLSATASTYMGNLVVRLPTGPVQPYASGGIGLIRISGDVDVPFVGNVLGADAQDLGMNFGGGVYVFPIPNVGIRGDVRYFRTVGDLTLDDLGDIGGLDDLPLPELDFWRISGGVTLRF